MGRYASSIGALVAAGVVASAAFGNTGSTYDAIDDSKGNASQEITLAMHGHQSNTRLEHQVYVKGEPDRLHPPKIYFDTTDDEEADFVFRRRDGKFEVVRMNGTRSKEAAVKRITEHGISIRFQEGAISSPQSYHWYVAFVNDNGKVLDRAHDETWKYHDLNPGYP
jgi:hypothetical protein